MKKRTGIFGGAFNPVHHGHIQLAKRAMERYGLERMLFLPTASPPHKKRRGMAAFSHRLAMLELALKDCPGCEITAVEGELPGPNFTIDTLEYLRGTQPTGEDALYFLIGEDAFLELETWKEYRKVLGEVHCIVLKRSRDSKHFDSFLHRLGYLPAGECRENPQTGKRIYFLEDMLIDISSTSIRENIRRNRSIEGSTDAAIVEYIRDNGLYLR